MSFELRSIPDERGKPRLYLLQLPVFPSGPLSRFHDFEHQLARADVSMAGFSYGVRRISQGLTKVYLVAGPLVEAWGAQAVFMVLTVLLLAASVVTAFLPSLRGLDDPPLPGSVAHVDVRSMSPDVRLAEAEQVVEGTRPAA